MFTLHKHLSGFSVHRDGKAVGHIGRMAGGTMCFVNLHRLGLVFKSHNGDPEVALREAITILTREGTL